MAQTAGGTYYAASSELVSSWPATSLDLANQLETRFAAKAALASPTFTGTPAAPTAAAGTNTTQIATTAFVQAASGLTQVASQSFSAVSSLSLNNVFSSTYDNYRILLDVTSMSTSASVRWRFRASGADNTTSFYQWAHAYFLTGNAFFSGRASAQAQSIVVDTIGQDSQFFVIDCNAPNLARMSRCAMTSSHGAGDVNWFGAFGFSQTNQFDGFSVFPSTGTLSGSVTVFGYKK
jgi:hypothetical protein